MTTDTTELLPPTLPEMAAKLDEALGEDKWPQRTGDASVVAERPDAQATVVGNELGNWWATTPPKNGSKRARWTMQQYPSAAEAVAAARKVPGVDS